MTKYLIQNRGQSVLHKREAAKKETKEKIQAEVLKKVDKHIQKFESKRLQKYSLEVMMYSTNPAHPTQKHSYVNKKIKFYLITNPTREFRVKAPNPFPSDLYRKFIPKYDPEDKTQTMTEEWKRIMHIMKTDHEFKELYDLKPDYIEAIYVKNYDSLQPKGKPYKPLQENLKNGNAVSINYKYIETNIDLKFDTLQEAIENKNYIKNECWINTIVDFYGSTLMSENKRKHVTREIILQDINKTEENIKDGVSVKDIISFFSQNIIYNLEFLISSEHVFINIIHYTRINIIRCVTVW
jgi:hypothetical protein